MVITSDPLEEIETLGLIAARCDVMSSDPTLNWKDRNELLSRALKYREMQFVAMAELSEESRKR